ncbi:sensor histidine kinase [Sphingomonas astaxanthinifaciens]|uniref:histidine kinase n=1 Tax=Sphingomonas astaxanthinifaciens DSM 22298 TaxID=1123267 RepID=A0ABQ5Z820_9SPHN|nr:histidine kinase dimerization/phosphoacceptor domain -containing protein [Sphingomonas astaxanthinifaciens]GLR48109.1 histidine kinase [Sphingomonas astaxanthinifaciens DSM 22298]
MTGRWTENFPLARIGVPGDVLVAVASCALATGLRFLLDDQLPPGFPFLTYFPVVILAAFVFGLRAGILTALGCGLAAWYWFVPPSGSFQLEHNARIAMGFYGFITATEIALVHWMQRANRLLVAEREANARLAQTRELLFRELQHRVSNNLQMVAALLTVQRRQLSDESARSALDEAARRLQTVGRISRQLYDPSGSGQKLETFLRDLARDVIDSSGGVSIAHEVSGHTDASIAPEAAIPLALVVAESIANAIEHGFDEGQDDRRLWIRLQPLAAERLAVEIEDNGRGLPAGFSLGASDSLGLKIATMLAGQLGGSFTLGPGSARGALARLELPLQPA